jgi:hypothetical protein
VDHKPIAFKLTNQAGKELLVLSRATVKRMYSRPLMAIHAVGCVASYESGWPNAGADAVGTISAGQNAYFTAMGLFSLRQAYGIS